MNDALRLRFTRDTDGTGELLASVRSQGFAGASHAWFNTLDLIEFAHKLAESFPLPVHPPLSICGGFLRESGDGIEQEHVGIRFYPVGSLGRVGCRVRLATPAYEHDRPEEQAFLAVELLTTYEQLGAFARSLTLLASGEIDEAILEADG